MGDMRLMIKKVNEINPHGPTVPYQGQILWNVQFSFFQCSIPGIVHIICVLYVLLTAHWTVVNEGNRFIRLHNKNNYLAVVNGSTLIVTPVSSIVSSLQSVCEWLTPERLHACHFQESPSLAGAETKLKLVVRDNYVLFESSVTSNQHIGILPSGHLKSAAVSGRDMDSQFGTVLVVRISLSLFPSIQYQTFFYAFWLWFSCNLVFFCFELSVHFPFFLHFSCFLLPLYCSDRIEKIKYSYPHFITIVLQFTSNIFYITRLMNLVSLCISVVQNLLLSVLI